MQIHVALRQRGWSQRTRENMSHLPHYRPSVCFISIFWTNWPLAMMFACLWTTTTARRELKAAGKVANMPRRCRKKNKSTRRLVNLPTVKSIRRKQSQITEFLAAKDSVIHSASWPSLSATWLVGDVDVKNVFTFFIFVTSFTFLTLFLFSETFFIF